MDIIKSLCIGGDLVGISGEILKHLIEGGYDKANKYMRDLTYKIRVLMLLTGSKNIEELKKTPYKVKGDLKDLI